MVDGEKGLIHAAGGGVSSAAIQLARKMGATVLATARSDRKLAHAARLGAEHLFNHQSGGMAQWAREMTGGRGVDMVFDHLGPALWAPSLAALRPRGRLVNCGATTGPLVTLELGPLQLLGQQILGSDAYRYEEFERVLSLYWQGDRKSTRLNSSHTVISYAVFCLKKKRSHEVRLCVITVRDTVQV